MTGLTEIVSNMAHSYDDTGYIREDGTRVEYQCNPPDWGDPPGDARVLYRYTFSERQSLPEKVLDYLRENGFSIREVEGIYDTSLTLKRVSDGKEDTFSFTDFSLFHIHDKKKAKRTFSKPSVRITYMWGYIMEPEEFAGLVRFLREAGVEFEPDAPPWMKDALELVEEKRSPKRRGMDAARFLGFE